jgi:hypothetical protein
MDFVIDPGAQTESPGRCRAGESFAWRLGFTGRFCFQHGAPESAEKKTL